MEVCKWCSGKDHDGEPGSVPSRCVLVLHLILQIALIKLSVSHVWVVQALPEGEAGTVVTLRVDVSQNRYEEGGRLPLRNQLPTTGLTELRRKKRRRLER